MLFSHLGFLWGIRVPDSGIYMTPSRHHPFPVRHWGVWGTGPGAGGAIVRDVIIQYHTQSSHKWYYVI